MDLNCFLNDEDRFNKVTEELRYLFFKVKYDNRGKTRGLDCWVRYFKQSDNSISSIVLYYWPKKNILCLRSIGDDTATWRILDELKEMERAYHVSRTRLFPQFL